MELLAINDLNTSETPDFLYDSYNQFNIDDRWVCCRILLSEATHFATRGGATDSCSFELRPEIRFTGTKGLCMLLKRLAYPCRYLIYRFGSPVPVPYAWLLTKYTCDTHHHKITNWNNGILNPAALQMYADAISAKGAALENCFGCIDGTVRAFSKPGEQQRVT